MIDTAKLATELRARAIEVRDWPEQDGVADADRFNHAADAIEEQAARIVELEEQLTLYKIAYDFLSEEVVKNSVRY